MINCDLIVKGKYLLTMSGEEEPIIDGALAVTGGRIAAVGRSDAVERNFCPRATIDCGHGIIIPGLVNTHTHAAMTYFRGLADDLPLPVWLEKHIWPAEAKFVRPEFVRRSSELAVLEMIKSGITAFNDMYFFADETARVSAAAGIRAMVGEGVLDFPTPSSPGPADALARTAALAQEYRGHELIDVSVAPHSLYTLKEKNLSDAMAVADRLKLPLHMHIAETREELLNCRRDHRASPVGYLDRLGLFERPVIAVHSVWVDSHDMDIYAAKGVRVSHNPISNMKLAAGVLPVMKMLERRKIAVGLATDGAASNNVLDLFSDMRVCSLVHKAVNGDPAVLKAYEILGLATFSGARVMGKEAEYGTLTTGRRADIVTVGLERPHLLPVHDPYSHLVYCAHAGDVENVIINGRVIMRGRRMLTMDEERILAEAKAFSAR